MKKVTIHTDGGCTGNPGPGGWGAVLSYGGQRKELSGGTIATTNNRMELQGAIAALGALKEPCEVDFYTDSQYVRQGITEWIAGWKRKGWVTTTKQAVKNAEQWKALDALAATHRIRWHWVRGHTGNEGNERCDQLCQSAIAEVKRRYSATEIAGAVKDFQQERAEQRGQGSLL